MVNDTGKDVKEDSPLEIPELDLMYAPPLTFPEPIWERDSTRVSDELRKITSSWTLPIN